MPRCELTLHANGSCFLSIPTHSEAISVQTRLLICHASVGKKSQAPLIFVEFPKTFQQNAVLANHFPFPEYAGLFENKIPPIPTDNHYPYSKTIFLLRILHVQTQQNPDLE